MKKILSLCAALCLLSGTLVAQNAEAVLERYYKTTGLDRIDLDCATARIGMEVSSGGTIMTMSNILQLPGKMRTQMNIMGQSVEIIVNADQGWIVVPGLPAQPLPQNKIQEVWDQSDLFSSMKWNLADYTLALLNPVTENDSTFNVVEMTSKKEDAPFQKQMLYFDQTTGLLDHAVVTVATPQGDMTVTVYYKNYTKSGDVLYPSLLENQIGIAVSTIRITEFMLNYPVSDAMFAKPE